jgi:hypothetical protein
MSDKDLDQAMKEIDTGMYNYCINPTRPVRTGRVGRSLYIWGNKMVLAVSIATSQMGQAT